MAAALVIPADMLFPVRVIVCGHPIPDTRFMLGVDKTAPLRSFTANAMGTPTPIVGIADAYAHHPAAAAPLNMRALAVFGADLSIHGDVVVFGVTRHVFQCEAILDAAAHKACGDVPDWLIDGFANVVR